MKGFSIFNVNEMVENLKTENESGEVRVKSILSTFCCPLNEDVQTFLRSKAVEFDKQSISRTYIVYASYKGEQVLVGYFALSQKVIQVKKDSINSTFRRRIAKFAQHNDVARTYDLSAVLIGQLGKNYNNNYNSLITGDELIKMALDRVKEVQKLVGGKIVYLECEHNDKLIDFYQSHGFYNFGKRQLDTDEIGLVGSRYYIQLLKYM